MLWPESIEFPIDAIQSAEFLNEEEKEDILYNAANYHRLWEEEINEHYRKIASR